MLNCSMDPTRSSNPPPNDRSYVEQQRPKRNPTTYQPTGRRVVKMEEMFFRPQRHRHNSIISRYHTILTLTTPFQSNRAPVTARPSFLLRLLFGLEHPDAYPRSRPRHTGDMLNGHIKGVVRIEHRSWRAVLH